jgi:surface antigen
MRADLGGITRGNAANWLNEARGRVPEGSTPVVGAIAVNTTADRGVGHVAYVAGVANGGATLILDEANVYNNGGVFLNVATPASDFQGYIYGGPAGNGPGGAPVASESTRPGAIANSATNMNVFSRGSGSELLNAYWISGTGWVNQTLPGGSDVAGDPSVVARTADSMDVAFRTPNGSLGEDYWSSTGGWVNQVLPGGNDVAGNPSGVANSASWMNFFFRTPSGTLAEDYWTSGTGWVNQTL